MNILLDPAAAPAAGAPPVAAPTAPAPAPKPAAAPPAPARPASTPAPDDGPDPFADMDKRIADIRESKKAIREPKVEPPKPESKPGEPAADPKAGQQPPQPDPAPKQLRQQYEKTAAELKQKSEAMTALERRIAEAEAKGKDATSLAERLAARDKEYEALQVELRGLKAEMSPEFVEKYEKPFNRAAEHAKKVFSKLRVGGLVEDEQTGATVWKPERQADWEKDFGKLYYLHRDDPATAIEEVEKMFGKSASIVLNQIGQLEQLDTQMADAKAEERSSWKERQTKAEAERAQQKEAYESASAKVKADYIEKHPDWYGEDPEDKEGNAMLKDGFALLEKKPSTFRESVMLYERNKLNAAAFPRMAARAERLAAELAEAKATIEEMKKSGPGRTNHPGGGEGGPAEKNWRDDLRETVGA